MEEDILEDPSSDYQSYRFTENGVSPRIFPGEGPVVRANSYEHDEYGYMIEEAEGTKKMNDKRWAKLPFLQKEINRLEPVKIYGSGKNLIVGWGSTKGAILDSLKDLPGYRFMQISYISPFPIQSVTQELQKAKKVVLVENNVTGLLGQIIREQTGFEIKDKVLKYDARPFTPEDIIQKIKIL